MKFQSPDNVIKSLPPEIIELLGPPPLLSNEDPKIYYAMLAYFAEDFNPNDIVAWFLAKDLLDYWWEIQRYRRIKAGRMQKAQDEFLKGAERDIKSTDDMCRASIAASYVGKVKALEKSLAKNPEELATRKSKCHEQEQARTKDAEKCHQQNLAGLKAVRESGRAVAYSLHSWVADVETVDRFLEVAEKGFHDALRAIERHLGGFGQTIRERANKIIDGEVVTPCTAAPVNGKYERVSD